MPSIGMKARLRHQPVDERLAKALSHPTRLQILERLGDDGVTSPSELAHALGEPLANVSYHVRILCEFDCVELVRTEPRRGALEHFYRATVGPWLDDEQWAGLPASFRRKLLGRTLSEIVGQVSEARREGGFDSPETHVSRLPLAVDESGFKEITALLTATLEAGLRIHADSANRQAQHGPDGPPTITTALAMMHFRNADTDRCPRSTRRRFAAERPAPEARVALDSE